MLMTQGVTLGSPVCEVWFSSQALWGPGGL